MKGLETRQDCLKGKTVIDLWTSSEVESKKQLDVEGKEKTAEDIKISGTVEWMDKNKCSKAFRIWKMKSILIKVTQFLNEFYKIMVIA